MFHETTLRVLHFGALVVLCIDDCEFPSFSFPAMVIGFTQRIRTVSENSSFQEQNNFTINIDIATLRVSEREQQMIFRLEPGGTAIVEPFNNDTNPLLDTLFGSRLGPDDPLEEFVSMEPLEDSIPSPRVTIIGDFRAEAEECFTIRLIPVNVPGRCELFSCNEDGSREDNYFCETTICIEDFNGRFAGNMNFW